MAYLNGNMNIMRFVTRENEAPRYKGIFPLPIDSVGGTVSEWYMYGNKNGVGEKQIVNGNLPLNFVSDGTSLENYRVYGTAEGAGVQTENLCELTIANCGIDGNGKLTSSAAWQMICAPIVSGEEYTIVSDNIVYGLYASKPEVGSTAYDSTRYAPGGTTRTFTADMTGWLAIRIESGKNNVVMLVKGSTAPPSYIPYGYKFPLTVKNSTETKTIDVYIGDSKLGEEEYVDYGEQKIYIYKRILFMTHDDKHFITKDNKNFCLRRRGYNG